MIDAIIEVLARSPGAMGAGEIVDELRRSGVRAEEFEVLGKLREMQASGWVRMERNRWHLLRSPKSPDGGSRRKNVDQGKGVSSFVLGSVKGGRSTSLSSGIQSRRWGVFRKLCHYYVDCLVQEEAPQLKGYVDNEDDTWLTLRQVPWARVAMGDSFAVALDRNQSGFNRNRARRGDEECIYLGYPTVFVKPKGMSGFLVPFFAQPMKADWRGGVLTLTPDGPVSVNGSWLEYKFSKRADRDAFLSAIGFVSAATEDGEDGTPPPDGFRRLDKLAEDTALYIHDPERFAQQIEPFSLVSVEDWNEAEPGLYNSALLTLGPRFRYTRSLIRDLKEIAGLDDAELDLTALAALFPHDEVVPPGDGMADSATAQSPIDPPIDATLSEASKDLLPEFLAQTRMLHPSQRASVVNALDCHVSVVTGPPGTGKSEVVAAMLRNQLLRGRPTLFASKNHQALEAVVPRLNDTDAADSLIVQASGRDFSQRDSYLAKLQELLARPPRADMDRGMHLRQQLIDVFTEQSAALRDIDARAEAQERYERLTAKLNELRAQLPIAIRGDPEIGVWPATIGREQLASWQSELTQLSRQPRNWLERLWVMLRSRTIRAKREELVDHLEKLPSPFVGRDIPAGMGGVDELGDFFSAWITWAEASQVLQQARDCEVDVTRIPSAESLGSRLKRCQLEIENLTAEWMSWAAGGLPSILSPEDRETLSNLRAGIQTWGAGRFKKELRRDFPLILRSFPLWSVSNLSARSAFPLVPGLFELVIIDEASQCDIASVIPLLARSRRAVFSGDPMQLTHVCTLDPAVEQTLLHQHELLDASLQRFTYRVNSAYDLANGSSSVPEGGRVRLDLHFRSHDRIADYCNDAFYTNTLRVVTVSEKLNVPRGKQAGIHWTPVSGDITAAQSGAWSGAEVQAVMDELRSLAVSDFRGTVGVVTPFRQQTIRLKDAVDSDDQLPREFKERVDLHVDTAYGFQGGERDLVLFSLCGGPDLSQGGLWFFREQKNQFNVAVSRARAVLHVIGNRDWALNCGMSHVEKLARCTLDGNERRNKVVEPYQSPWEKTLADALREAGVDVKPQYPIAGRFLDLGILSPTKIDVEVDGEAYHRTAGGGRKDDDHWRDLQLESLGWKVCRFWVYELREDLPKCVERVKRLMHE